METEKIIGRIDVLLGLAKGRIPEQNVEVIASTLSLLVGVYGPTDQRVEDFKLIRTSYASSGALNPWRVAELTLPAAVGALRMLKSECEGGLILSLRRRHNGEIISDFTTMARTALDDGFVSVAAVLACAALEDALKRVGELKGLEVSEKHMPEVITALIQEKLIVGPQATIVRGFVKMRNRVMHAQFENVDSSGVLGVLAFTEGFILTHLA